MFFFYDFILDVKNKWFFFMAEIHEDNINIIPHGT